MYKVGFGTNSKYFYPKIVSKKAGSAGRNVKKMWVDIGGEEPMDWENIAGNIEFQKNYFTAKL